MFGNKKSLDLIAIRFLICSIHTQLQRLYFRVALMSAKNHKRQRRVRQPVTANRKKSQTQKFVTAILT